jgi:hypothetical protein
MMRPILSDPLGSYPDREEFQIERVIVWVQIPSHGSRIHWVNRANQLIEGIWRAIPSVVEAAQQESRKLLPDFWKAHTQAGTASEQLTVHGIWIDPVNATAGYDVGENFDRRILPDSPELPDMYSIMVNRDSAGNLLARG